MTTNTATATSDPAGLRLHRPETFAEALAASTPEQRALATDLARLVSHYYYANCVPGEGVMAWNLLIDYAHTRLGLGNRFTRRDLFGAAEDAYRTVRRLGGTWYSPAGACLCATGSLRYSENPADLWQLGRLSVWVTLEEMAQQTGEPLPRLRPSRPGPSSDPRPGPGPRLSASPVPASWR